MLNEQQKQAEEDIKKWLTGPRKYHTLSGMGGTGKTFLLKHILDNMAHYNKRRKLMGERPIVTTAMTATTNKAASLLPDGVTIHKHLGLVLIKRVLKCVKDLKACADFIIIDEISGASSALIDYIDRIPDNRKILFVGDHAQLPPVGEDISRAFEAGGRISHLTEPMRQGSNSDLLKLCMRLRETVETGKFKPIREGVGIRFVTASDAHNLLSHWFKADVNAKYIAYTNKQVIKANKVIRASLGRKPDWTEGDLVVIRNNVKLGIGGRRIPCETVTHITHVGHPRRGEGQIPYREVRTTEGVLRVPHLWDDVVIANKRNDHTDLTEMYADLRDAYACTAHVSQGSTYDKVLIDLKDLATCAKYDKPLFAKLLYVAVSRAKEEVFFYGNIPTNLLR